ncbi:esterase family protein [Herbiconiux moechotypicola]|uniref:Alpha/beta hydrolase-fold protein n=1 Tax=Herbiconiux moechotypicola TaxID=637393 RepID=A0ABN3DLH2_9MICO|nr:esterase family protein [Herbiconiux moechotypicola]MCS5730117.1 esterase family protein [Herbiconiux moechotypicola]
MTEEGPVELILEIRIVDGPFLWGTYALAAAVFLFLLLRRPTRRWVVTAASALVGGTLAALLATFVVQDVLNVFNSPMTITARAWIVLAGASVALAVVNLWRSRWWRKLVAVWAIALFAWTATLGISADFGILKNLGDLLDVSTEKPLDLASLAPHSVNPEGPLADSWQAPVDMPTTSIHGTVTIPASDPSFTPRDAVVYLPPAAQLPDAPALPVVVFLSGQPGAPDVADIGTVLDGYAAAHDGLAPIVVSIDHLGGSSANNPLCVDGYQGDAFRYVNTDAPAFIADTFNVLPGREYWTIAGFSNGGECAIASGAANPERWGSIIDISGELEPDLGTDEETLDIGFGGDQAAYDAAKPLNLLRAGAADPATAALYAETTAVFADGSDDEPYLTATRTLFAAATEAGMRTHLVISPGTGHESATIEYGFERAFAVLYPEWGLG